MSKAAPRTGGRFYGWFALTGTMLVIFAVGGAFVNSFGVFLPVISGDLGWNRGTVALSLSVGVLAFGLPSPLFGIIVKRYGGRLPIILGNLLAGLGLMGVSLVHEIWQIYLCYMIIGVGAGFGGYIPASTIANNWFIKKRSLAMGMFMSCGALGGFAFPPIVAALIEVIGWRMSYVAIGAVALVFAVIIGGVVLVRNRPEDMGQLPDGVSLMGGFAAANAFTLGTMSTHQVAYLQDIGFTSLTAASTISMMSAMSVVGSIGFGSLALKYNPRNLAMVGFASQLAAIGLLLSTRQLGLLYVYAAFLGIGNGALLTAMPTFVGGFFSRRDYSQALGFVFPFQVVSQAIAGFVAGVIYDSASSYRPAFLLLIGFMLLGMFMAFLAGSRRRAKAP
jgi:MFS family permease